MYGELATYARFDHTRSMFAPNLSRCTPPFFVVTKPGFWALFWYRLSHALLQQNLPVLSPLLPRLVMSIVRYCTAIDIHPGATISAGGIFIDHGTGLVVGATAVIGEGATLYHGVTLGNSGKKVRASIWLACLFDQA